MVTKRRRRSVLWESRICMRLVAAFAAVVVLFGIAQAGSSYFYCPAMHMVMEAPC